MIKEIARLQFTDNSQVYVVPAKHCRHRVAHIVNGGGAAWSGGTLRAYGSCDAGNVAVASAVPLGAVAIASPAPKDLPLNVSEILTAYSPWPFLVIASAAAAWAGTATVIICAEVKEPT